MQKTDDHADPTSSSPSAQDRREEILARADGLIEETECRRPPANASVHAMLTAPGPYLPLPASDAPPRSFARRPAGEAGASEEQRRCAAVCPVCGSEVDPDLLVHDRGRKVCVRCALLADEKLHIEEMRDLPPPRELPPRFVGGPYHGFYQTGNIAPDAARAEYFRGQAERYCLESDRRTHIKSADLERVAMPSGPRTGARCRRCRRATCEDDVYVPVYGFCAECVQRGRREVSLDAVNVDAKEVTK